MYTKNIVIEKIADAIRFTQLASAQPFDIDIKSGRHQVDAKSQLGIFTIDLSSPSEVIIHAAEDGSQDAAAEAFLKEIAEFIV